MVVSGPPGSADRRASWAAPAALVVGVAAAIAAAVVAAQAIGPWVGRPLGQREVGPATARTTTAAPAPDGTLGVPDTADSGRTLVTLLIILGCGALMIALLFLLRSILRHRWQDAERDLAARPVVEAGVGFTVDLVDDGAPDRQRPFDARVAADAVIAHWMRLERVAAEYGHRRLPHQTPTEFISSVGPSAADSSAGMADPVARALLSLYQRARFDLRALTPESAAQAARAADRMCAELAGAPVLVDRTSAAEDR